MPGDRPSHRVLYTTPILEHPPAGGPQLRIENSIKALARVSELHLVSRTGRKGIGGASAEAFYRERSATFAYSPTARRIWSNRISRRLEGLLPNLHRLATASEAHHLLDRIDRLQIEVLWFGYGNISFPLMQAVRKARPGLKMVCDTDSVWSRFLLRELPFVEDPQRREEIERQGSEKAREERAWVEFCDVTTAVSPVDVDYYQCIAPDKGRIHQFSNVIDLSSYPASVAPPPGFRRPSIYLAGSFGHPRSPMDTAARWMATEVLPRVAKFIPETHLYIVGNRSDRTLADLPGPSITVTGRLPSVLPYLLNASVAVVPLKFESGTRFKILEAAAAGVPVVSTSLGAEGLPVRHGEHILIADEADAFAAAIVKLIESPHEARRIALNCRDLVRRDFGLDRLETEARAILDFLDR